MFKTFQRSRITRSLLVAAAATAALVGSAAPASAGPPWSTDDVLIAGAVVDFGAGPIVAGNPQNPGTLKWETKTVAGVGIVTPHLEGKVYAINSANRAVRVLVECYDADHNSITSTPGAIKTPPDNLQHSFTIDLKPCEASNVFHVHVSTQQETVAGSGVFANVNATQLFDI
jgi:hypothetical protein